MTHGITPSGFNRKSKSAIVASIEQRQLATIAADLDVSAESIIGQLNGIYAGELDELWGQLATLAGANDPDQAEGDLLEQICKLSGTERRGASYSTVVLSCTLEEDTVLETGVAYAAVDGDPGSLWTPVANFTAPSTGTHNVQFRAESPGPVNANATTITVIHSPVSGWSAVTNPEGAAVGRPVDSDETLRQRREEQIASAGSATARAIRADLLEIEDIDAVRVFENTTNVTDGDGLPPHSIEVLVYDGPGATVANNLIAQAIFDAKGAGIGTHGTASGVAVNDGVEHIVYFSRPEQRPVYIETTLATVEGYLSDEETAAHIVARGREFYGMGDTVRRRQIDSVAFELDGVDDVTAFTLGFSASPVGTVNLEIGPREIATFDTSRTTVTHTP